MMRGLLILGALVLLIGCGEDGPSVCDCVNNMGDKKLQAQCAEKYYREDLSEEEKTKYYNAAQECEGSKNKGHLDHNYMNYPSPCDCKRLSEDADVQKMCTQKFKLNEMDEASRNAWNKQQEECPEYK